VALFVNYLRRSVEGLQALLGETITGIVGSDRWSANSKLPLKLRQIRWVHLKRDFQKLIDRGGPAEAIGQLGLEVVECLFADWWAFRRGELDRPGLQARLDPTARELRGVLEQGRSCADSNAATVCVNLLALYPALWLFPAIEGSSRRTIMQSESCAWACCGGRTPSVATARRGASSGSGC
jgi:transposase